MDPAFLPDLLGAAAFLPEVDAADVLMGPPEGAVMIVIRRRGMAHTRQRTAGRSDEGVEERPGIAGGGVPAEAFLAVHLEGNLVVGLGHELNARHLVSHEAPGMGARLA